MRGIRMILLVAGAVYFSGCAKGDAIPTVTGTINGVPAVTLYGTTSLPVDYVLLSTNGSIKEIEYGGQVYNYFNSPFNGIYIVLSPSNGVAGTIDTLNSKTVITLTPPISRFASTQYSSR